MPNLPRFFDVEQAVPRPVIDDVASVVREHVLRLADACGLPPGARVAVTAGSRKIARIAEVLRAVTDALKETGRRPFIVPAMGSHGGATAEGQRDVIAGYGITEDTIGAPIASAMDVVELGVTPHGMRVFCDRNAAEADGIVVVNRVKAHTRFFGSIESGLTKMSLVGLGKRAGAEEIHSAAQHRTFDELVVAASKVWRPALPPAFGIALVENAFGELARIEGAQSDDFNRTDTRLLREANALMCGLPVHDIDLLIVDRMGKDISGTGMDVNVIGARPDSPTHVRRIFARDLTAGSKGNAHGIGFAYVTTQRLVDGIDLDATLANARAAHREEAAEPPRAFETDAECLAYALEGLPDAPRIVHIADTAHPVRCRLSEAYVEKARVRTDLRILSEPVVLHPLTNGHFPAAP